MNKNMIEAMEGNGEFVGEAPCIAVNSPAQISIAECRGTAVGMVSIDREELARLRADSAELARVREPISDIEIHNIAFEIAATDDRGGYYFEPDDLEKFVAELRPIPEGFALVPVEVKRDAERYRWLRNYAYGHFDCGELCGLFGYNNEIIDEKVDALLAAAPKGDSHE